MAVRLTRKRIDILCQALNYMEAEHEGMDDPPHQFSTWEEWEAELEACHEWLRQTERKRNKQRKTGRCESCPPTMPTTTGGSSKLRRGEQ